MLELRDDERQRLLQKLRNASSVSTEPLLARAPRDSGKTDYIAAFQHLDFFTKIFLLIKGIVTNQSKADLIKERQVKSLLKKLESQCMGLVDVKRKFLLESFWQELVKLRQSARYFYDLLDKTLEKRRPAFFAFLASLELEEVHEELVTQTDPWYVEKENSLASDTDIRNLVAKAMENALTFISEEQRRNMYHDVHSLYVLRKLSVFHFDKFLGAFQINALGQHEMSFWAASDSLMELDSILGSILVPPSLKLMEALLAFEFNDDYSSKTFNLDLAIKEELIKADQALSGIRTFNSRVPIDILLQAAKEDPEAQSGPVAGGEDWFALFKSYWRERTEKSFVCWQSERRMLQLKSEIAQLVGTGSASRFVFMLEEGSETTPPMRLAKPILFLESFYYTAVLGDLNRIFKIILMEGEFYKRDNKKEFTDSYNLLLQTGEDFKAFDLRLGPEGELGRMYIQACADQSPIAIKRRKIETAIQAAETEAETILRRLIDAINRIFLIFKGILSGDSKGKYDSLSNLSRIDGKANKDFMKAIENAKERLEKATYLANELTRIALISANAVNLGAIAEKTPEPQA